MVRRARDVTQGDLRGGNAVFMLTGAEEPAAQESERA